MKYLSKKWIFVSFLPLLVSCETEPKNPNSFEYFKWHNENYQWDEDKYGDDLAINDCKIKLGNVSIGTIFESKVYLDEGIRQRLVDLPPKKPKIKYYDTYLVYFPLDADFYPLPYDKKIQLNVLKWSEKVDCVYFGTYDGVIVVQSIKILGEE